MSYLVEKSHAADIFINNLFNDGSVVAFFSTLVTPTARFSTLSGLLAWTTSVILFIAGFLAFLYLIYAGILYITSGGNPEQARRGQLGLIYAVIGIILVVLSWAILQAAVNLARGII